MVRRLRTPPTGSTEVNPLAPAQTKIFLTVSSDEIFSAQFKLGNSAWSTERRRCAAGQVISISMDTIGLNILYLSAVIHYG